MNSISTNISGGFNAGMERTAMPRVLKSSLQVRGVIFDTLEFGNLEGGRFRMERWGSTGLTNSNFVEEYPFTHWRFLTWRVIRKPDFLFG
jgi:hypothetical protein